MVIVVMSLGTLEVGRHDPQPPLVGAPTTEGEPKHYTDRSIETLLVVLAAITIVGVIAGMFCWAVRQTTIGWVERRCRSCIDVGVPAATPKKKAKPTAEEAKK
ncbi:hypothetical protein I3843_10G031400 [Carya illinoinensis]|nr:hypothetical protein I3843_10G031400 [Carya illinoinensis]